MEDKALGRWAVIDIETTGVDPATDEIIDVGFLEFEGTTLTRSYSSLVRPSINVPPFIQKLTGITQKMAEKAPIAQTVKGEVQELCGANLLAYNASFEQKFLNPWFEELYVDSSMREGYGDGLLFIPLLFPELKSLKLEAISQHWLLAEKEEHRGLSDSIDLLKAMIFALAYGQKDHDRFRRFQELMNMPQLEGLWIHRWAFLSLDELHELASACEFDIDEAISRYETSLKEDISQDFNPTGHDIEFSGKLVENIFSDDGRLKEAFPDYKKREGQVQLALRTGQAFKNDVHALVQAPTGTGKTLGYMIPASLFSLCEKKQVLVATGTKALQTQALNKDAPILRKVLGKAGAELKIKKLVGSSNHFCESLFRGHDNYNKTSSNDTQLGLFEEKANDEIITDTQKMALGRAYLEMLFFVNSLSGVPILRDDISYALLKNLGLDDWISEIAVDYKSCSGPRCPFQQDCSYVQGLRDAKDADIIVANHALMYSWPRSFPRPGHLVVDEAHRLEEETTRAFTLELSGEALHNFMRSLTNGQQMGSLYYILSSEEVIGEGSLESAQEKIEELQNASRECYQGLFDHMPSLEDKVELLFKKSPRYTELFWNELPMAQDRENGHVLEQGIRHHLEGLKAILEFYFQRILPFTGRWEAKNFKDDQLVLALVRFETFAGVLEDLVATIQEVLKEEGDFARSMKFHAERGILFSAAPIDVGRRVHDALLQTSNSVVMASATLGNIDGSSGETGTLWATGQLFLEKERRFKSGLYLGPVFDYTQKAKVFLCTDAPPFFKPEFIPHLISKVLPVIKELDGRTLLLFSAKKRFEAACSLLIEELEGKMPVFIQGMGSNIVEEFRKSSRGILVGMESFGEGIDIPGEGLQFLVIDKIPDLRMDLVIQKRRDYYDRQFSNEFVDYFLAHRTRSLQQKLGRLLRRESDFGAAIVVDSRASRWKGRTMGSFRDLMRPYQIEQCGLDEACQGALSYIKEQEDEQVATLTPNAHKELSGIHDQRP